MKKLLSIFILALIVTLGFSSTPAKADDIVELYPYDQQACLERTSECTKTKLGDSHWDVTYNGANWNIPRAGVQYVSEFEDADNSGTIESTEMTGTDWSSVGGMYINNTDEEVVLNPSSANRQDLSGSWRGLWAYFDENGKMQMFESFVTFEFMIFNDGTAEAPDWRLATEAEIAAFDAAADDAKPETTKSALIRLALDDTDSDGYVIEEIGFLNWANKNVDTTTAPEADWSTIVEGNPSDVVIPAGWTVISFGTIERSYSPSIKAWGLTFPSAMVDTATANMTYSYDDQPGWFNNLGGYDNDLNTDGINIIVDFQSEFDLPSDITAEWRNMYDDSDVLINSVENLDYTVDIKDMEGTVLETISYTYDATTEAYTASAAQTVIDSSVFGSQFMADYKVTTPEGDENVVSVDIVVGVFAPTFSGVEDHYINEMTTIDLMAGITADDGYGNDITDTIIMTKPDNLNVYSPIPGTYTINLEFTHNVLFEGIPQVITADGADYDWDTLNSDQGYNGDHLAIYTDLTNFRDIDTEYAMIYIVVGADGTIIGMYDRYNWNWTTPDADDDGNPEVDNTTYAGVPKTWQADLELEEGGFVIVVGRGNAAKAALRALPMGTAVTYQVGTEDQSFDILVEDSFTLTVDDITAPQAVVVNENYEIEVLEYDTAAKAILANVVAFDYTDSTDDLAIYVSNDGGLAVSKAGTYTVEVTVEDLAGNTTIVTFDVVVVEPTDIQGMIDDAVRTDEEIQNLIDPTVNDNVRTDEEIQKLIDDSITTYDETGCSGSLGTGSLVAALVAVMGVAGLAIIRKK